MTEQYKPEIGEYCEVFLLSDVLGGRWVKVKCVGHDDNGIIWRNGSDTQSYLYAELENVRRYEDPYTLFSRELKVLFDYDSRIFLNLNSSDYQAVIKLLWDNGYRKVEG